MVVYYDVAVYPAFTTDEDGRVTVDGWTESIEITPELVFDSPVMEREGAESEPWVIKITVANGWARYRVTGWKGWRFEAELIDSEGPMKGGVA